MANPNIVGVQTVRGKSSVSAYVKRTPVDFLVNTSSSGEILKVNTIIVANRDTSSAVNVTIQMNGSSTQGETQNLIDSISVAPSSSMVLVSKNTDLYVIENTKLSVFASKSDKISLVCSYEQISDGTPANRNDTINEFPDPIASDGQVIYSVPGTYSWVVPSGITSVCAVAIGGGGCGDDGNSGDGGGGGGAGGALVYANDIPVEPGETYTLIVGAGGSNGNGKNARAQDGGSSVITIGTFIMTATGGQGGASYSANPGATGATYVVAGTPAGVTVGGGAGGNGGAGYNGGGGGGGAGGYNGPGGAGSYSLTNSQAAAGSGFGSGGGGGPTTGGIGNNGGANGGNGQYDTTGGGGGGATIFSVYNPPTVGGNGNGSTGAGSKGGDGGWPGGGGGGSWDNNTGVASPGANGVIKILWGSNRSFPNTANDIYSVEYVVVGGGAGGGGAHSGGGGSGGYRSSVTGELSGGGAPAESTIPFPFGQTLTVTVGAAGSGGSRYVKGYNGSNSVFGTITALGGGGGGSEYGIGNSFGTGGGNATTSATPATGTSGQGFGGGINDNGGFGGGGGGGAGSVGGNVTLISGSTRQAGAGGSGVTSQITGAAVVRGGGGGGGGINTNVGPGVTYGGEPGSGGGGRGGGYTNQVPADGAGTTNTGGGGGGGGYPTEGGFSGGSGIVIIAYPDTLPALTSIGAGLTYDTPTRTGYRVYRFTAGTGSITFGS